ncbi:hypothetical protein R1flu_005393 [Riccia fluitans]|uniref:Uncharacterized protein n=1 Tax=Riccia fluitans TaxID=41844 RepID=A0ABD1YU03_9MARC
MKQYPGTRAFTCESLLGSRVVDYRIVDQRARESVQEFKILALQPESDHNPLAFTLREVGCTPGVRQKERKWRVRENLRRQYEQEVTSIILGQEEGNAAVRIITAIRQAAGRVFAPQRKQVDKVWFDMECANLRQDRSKGILEKTTPS